MARHQRKFRNYFLKPALQLKISILLILLMWLFFAGTFAFTYNEWNDILGLLVELSDIPESAQSLVDSESKGFLIGLGVLLLIQILVLTIYIVILTHRFLGPSYAIEKYLREGDFSRSLHLRKGDYLQGVADLINQRLSEAGGSSQNNKGEE